MHITATSRVLVLPPSPTEFRVFLNDSELHPNLLQFYSGTNPRHASSNYTYAKICVGQPRPSVTCRILVRNPYQETEVDWMSNKEMQKKRVSTEE